MEKGKGKLAIAIVAMFVVALSIVGFTYAYFVAGVSENSEDTSVEVTAGILSVTYNGTQVLDVKNIVPGWISDNEHYYDATGSVYTVNGERGIKAVTAAECAIAKGQTGALENACTQTANKTNGQAAPVTFTVVNDNARGRMAYYIIKLTDIANPTTASTEDGDKIVYTLTDGTNTWTGDLAVTGEEQVIVTDGIAIDNATSDDDEDIESTHSYTLTLEYPNLESDQTEPAEGGKSLAATVSVVGVSKNGTQWFEEYSATAVEFAAASTKVQPEQN